jgi:hypothetical protein
MTAVLRFRHGRRVQPATIELLSDEFREEPC